MVTGAAMGVLGICTAEPKHAVSKSTVIAAEKFSERRRECNEIKFIDLY
jgi:hypothetical protein